LDVASAVALVCGADDTAGGVVAQLGRRGLERPELSPPADEVAARVLSSIAGFAVGMLSWHVGSGDGRCTGCARRTRWPCALAGIALRARKIGQVGRILDGLKVAVRS
jgi:hypothetical protein